MQNETSNRMSQNTNETPNFSDDSDTMIFCEELLFIIMTQKYYASFTFRVMSELNFLL